MEAAAEARARARAERDWPTADRLRTEIEAAGWKVVDDGLRYRLERAHPPDLVEAGVVRYGRSDAVPSRLAEPTSARATILVVAREDPDGAARAATAALRHAPAGVEAITVADGLDRAAEADIAGMLDATGRPAELVRTSAPLGQGAALNAGCRRAAGSMIVLLDASIEPTGDVVGPLEAALSDEDVAVAGPYGLVSADLRRFEEVTAGPAAAIEGYLQAFRRADYAASGPFDEGFRFYRNLDVWWSLVLRDRGSGERPREARIVDGLPLQRHDHVAWEGTDPAERDRLSKRNFYRLLDRFRDRPDLAVAAGAGSSMAAPGSPEAGSPKPGSPA